MKDKSRFFTNSHPDEIFVLCGPAFSRKKVDLCIYLQDVFMTFASLLQLARWESAQQEAN